MGLPVPCGPSGNMLFCRSENMLNKRKNMVEGKKEEDMNMKKCIKLCKSAKQKVQMHVCARKMQEKKQKKRAAEHEKGDGMKFTAGKRRSKRKISHRNGPHKQ